MLKGGDETLRSVNHDYYKRGVLIYNYVCDSIIENENGFGLTHIHFQRSDRRHELSNFNSLELELHCNVA